MVQSKHEFNTLPWVLGCEVLRNAFTADTPEKKASNTYCLPQFAEFWNLDILWDCLFLFLKMCGPLCHCTFNDRISSGLLPCSHAIWDDAVDYSTPSPTLHWAGTVTQAGPTLVSQNSLGCRQSSHLLYRKSQAAEWSQVQTSRIKCQNPYDILCTSRVKHIFLFASKWHPRINMVLHFAFSFN